MIVDLSSATGLPDWCVLGFVSVSSLGAGREPLTPWQLELDTDQGPVWLPAAELAAVLRRTVQVDEETVLVLADRHFANGKTRKELWADAAICLECFLIWFAYVRDPRCEEVVRRHAGITASEEIWE